MMAADEFLAVPFLPREVDLVQRTDGALIVRNLTPLGPIPSSVPAMFRETASRYIDKVWLAQRRGVDRAWKVVTYGDGLKQIDALTQALIDLDMRGRTIMALSGNSLELAALSLAAMQARMPIAPITPAYSLASQDHAKLKEMARVLKPGLIFVQSGERFERALRALRSMPGFNARVLTAGEPNHETHYLLDDFLRTPVRVRMELEIGAITSETHGKYLFTSGSTGSPKAVITTQQMMCAAISMFTQLVNDQGRQRQLVLDWLPWSHVMGGSAQFNLVIAAGGSLYIDDGRPTPTEFKETIRNLREIAPTVFSNVPIGYAMLAEALEDDPDLASKFFSRMTLFGYAGARLPDELYTRIQRLAVRHTGRKIPFTSGYGATETAAATTYVYWPTDRVGLIGLPHPGVELKLVPAGEGRYEVRTRSIAVTPGYLGNEEATRAAFDDEGFYKMGDAATFVDESDPKAGFLFAGRLTEDFKLLSGIFVHAEKLRASLLEALSPLVCELVITGADQAFVGLLAWPNLASCRQFIEPPGVSAEEIVQSPVMQSAIRDALIEFNKTHGATSMHVRRALLLAEPPSFDRGEVTAKGNINPKAVHSNRAAAVARLYSDHPDASVIRVD
ncbi:AMP-binding protein [Bradyrhizobium sp. SSUT18]|uniref:AMP-binding protein n=1 Tax=Bradyrhizobium sp. SSUT18 TaxID=3040602 RepID=UPI002447DC23|nr:AMP-binding protein [Bradyrhizobium sp. SSUT18]MDH2406806.1 AMP-binding protein [Bradyrhizobium sp. SSUT18]